MEELIKAWKKERDEAVRTLDVETFKKFYKKWMEREVYEIPLPKNEEVVKIAMMKMVLEIKSMPESVKMEARTWLRERGLKEGF